MSSASLTLPAKAPFDLNPALRFLKRNLSAGGSTVVSKDGLLHAALLNGRSAGFRVCPSAEPSGIEVEVSVEGDCDQRFRDQAAAYWDNFLSLSDDLAPFYAIAAKDKRFVSLVLPRLYGYHQAKFPSPVEAVVWAVLSQATPMPIARKLMASVAQAYGRSVTVGDTPLVAFPEVETLAETPKGTLRDLIGNERKAVTIQRAAAALASVDRIWLDEAPTEFVESWLREIPGIGAWSSFLILVRGLGRMDMVGADSPTALETMITAAKRVYGYRFDEKRYMAMLERYGPHAGYWLHYLRAGAAR